MILIGIAGCDVGCCSLRHINADILLAQTSIPLTVPLDEVVVRSRIVVVSRL